MPNRYYIRGRRLEYEVKKDYEAQGYIVMRTAGSRGPFDLIAVAKYQMAMGIQCKRVTTEAQAKRLLAKFRENPPIDPSHGIHQHLEVKIKGQKQRLYVTI